MFQVFWWYQTSLYLFLRMVRFTSRGEKGICWRILWEIISSRHRSYGQQTINRDPGCRQFVVISDLSRVVFGGKIREFFFWQRVASVRNNCFLFFLIQLAWNAVVCRCVWRLKAARTLHSDMSITISKSTQFYFSGCRPVLTVHKACVDQRSFQVVMFSQEAGNTSLFTEKDLSDISLRGLTLNKITSFFASYLNTRHYP